MEQARPDFDQSRPRDGDPRLPLYQRLHDAFARQVATRQWQPGQAIPAELALAALHGVAPGTVRKAIESLVAEGVLERRQGKGTFVRRADFTSSLFRFFRFQDSGGARRVPEARILKVESTRAPAEVARMLELPDGAEAIKLSRLRLFDGAPVLYEEIWLPRQIFAALLDLAPADFDDLLYPLYERLCGAVIASAEETLSAEAAAPHHSQPLGLAPGTPVMVIERLARGYDGKPLEWRRSRGPADKFRYQVEIR